MSHTPQPLAPISFAAYVTWLAIAAEPVITLWRSGWPPSALILAGLVGLVSVMGLFVWREMSHTRGRQRLLTLLQIPAALLSFAAFKDGLQPILLILIAVQAASLFRTRDTLLLMAAANAALLVVMLSEWPPLRAVVGLLSYLGFQFFAGLTSHALAAAQNARDESQRVTAELLSTRALLAQGARAEERLHLSRELHDVAGHKLTALKLQLGLCATTGSAQANTALEACRQLADELLADVRGVVGALRSHDGVDLLVALRALAANIPQPRITLVLADDARPADFARAQALLRAAQEGVTNALRHAGASALRIELARDGDLLKLSVIDNGGGVGRSAPGHGLTGLQERLAAVGGSVRLDALPQGGSALIATVPA